MSSALATLFYSHLVVRTRFYDEYLRAAGCAQVVLLAAGLDTRAFRLDWPAGTRLFELDPPEVLAFKEQVLAKETPRCAPGSRLAFEHRTRDDDEGILALARGLPGAEGLTALLKGGLAGNASEWLAEHCWRSRFRTDAHSPRRTGDRPTTRAATGS